MGNPFEAISIAIYLVFFNSRVYQGPHGLNERSGLQLNSVAQLSNKWGPLLLESTQNPLLDPREALQGGFE